MAVPTFNPGQDLKWAFSTPIVSHQLPDCATLNDELRAEILKHEQLADPSFTNIVGGWATTKDFFAWDAPCVREIAARLTSLMGTVVESTTQGPNVPPSSQFGMQSWANILRSGGYHGPHTHPNCYWSGAYYVSVGKADDNIPYNGNIELFDPSSAAGGMSIPGTTFQRKCHIKPEPGMAVLFPSWIKHMVHPFHGEGERISIAFNLVRR